MSSVAIAPNIMGGIGHLPSLQKDLPIKLLKADSDSGFAFNTGFYPGIIPRDKVAKQEMSSEFSGPRIDDQGNIFTADEPVIDAGGVNSYGSYENLIEYSEDLSQSGFWTQTNISISGTSGIIPDTSSDYHYVFNTSSPLTGADYSFSADVMAGASNTVYLRCQGTITFAGFFNLDTDTFTAGSGSPDGTIETSPNDPNFKRCTIYFNPGASNINSARLYLVPSNTTDEGERQFTGDGVSIYTYAKNFQLTETSHRMPYAPTDSETTQVSPNYSTADEGYKFQITPDEVGSLYTGDAVGDDAFDSANSFGTNITQNSDRNYVVDISGTSIPDNRVIVLSTLSSETVLITFTISGSPCSLRVYDYFTDSWLDYGEQPTGTCTLKGTSFSTGSVAIILEDAGATVNIDSIREVSRNMGSPDLLDVLDGAADGDEKWGPAGASAVLGDGWSTIDAYTYSCDGSQIATSLITNHTDLILGGYYEIKWEISNHTAGTVKPYVGGASSPDAQSANGVYIDRLTQAGSDNLYLSAAADFVGTVQIHHVKQISPASGEIVVEWTPMWGYDDQPANTNRNILTPGETENSLIWARKNSSNLPLLVIGDGSATVSIDSLNWTANTTYRIHIIHGDHPTETNSSELLENGDFSTYTGTIDDASEDTFDTWTLSESDGDAEFYSVSDAPAGYSTALKYVQAVPPGARWQHNFRQDVSYVTGGEYTVSFWARASDPSAIFRLQEDNNGNGNLNETEVMSTTWQQYTYSFTASSASDCVFIILADDAHDKFFTGFSLVRTDQPKMQIIVKDTAGTELASSSVVDFDGSFDPGDFVSIGWENEYWQKVKFIKAYKKQKSWGAPAPEPVTGTDYDTPWTDYADAWGDNYTENWN